MKEESKLNVRYCKKCKKYINVEEFYTSNGNDGYTRYTHKEKLCKKSKRKNVLWDDHLNIDTINEMRKWYDKNEQQIKAYNRNYGRFSILKLTDSYVKQILIDSGYPKEILNENPEIIKVKKEIIKINRYEKHKRIEK